MSLWPTISNCFCFMYHPKPWPFAKIHWLPFPRHDICWLSQVLLLFSPFRCYLRLDIPYIFNESHLGTIWVCLKIGYVSHLNAHFGKIIIDQGNGVIGVPYFQINQNCASPGPGISSPPSRGSPSSPPWQCLTAPNMGSRRHWSQGLTTSDRWLFEERHLESDSRNFWVYLINFDSHGSFLGPLWHLLWLKFWWVTPKSCPNHDRTNLCPKLPQFKKKETSKPSPKSQN